MLEYVLRYGAVWRAREQFETLNSIFMSEFEAKYDPVAV